MQTKVDPHNTVRALDKNKPASYPSNGSVFLLDCLGETFADPIAEAVEDLHEIRPRNHCVARGFS
jgi:hypothetical protein